MWNRSYLALVVNLVETVTKIATTPQKTPVMNVSHQRRTSLFFAKVHQLPRSSKCRSNWWWRHTVWEKIIYIRWLSRRKRANKTNTCTKAYTHTYSQTCIQKHTFTFIGFVLMTVCVTIELCRGCSLWYVSMTWGQTGLVGRSGRWHVWEQSNWNGRHLW